MPSIGQPSFIAYFDLATRSNGTDLISTMNGLFQTGGTIGTLILPYVADRWGRKWAIAVVGRFDDRGCYVRQKLRVRYSQQSSQSSQEPS